MARVNDPMKSVLCCSGLDPGGGAGIHADIQAISHAQVHPLALVTALTVQDTCDVSALHPVEVPVLDRQLAALRADIPIHAIKVGLLGSLEQIDWLARCLSGWSLPSVLDPVLRAGGGTDLVAQQTEVQMKTLMFPHCTVITPNAAEARRLSGCEDLDQAGNRLLEMGPAHVLITGGDESTPFVQNRWYRRQHSPHVFSWDRLPGRYHGAGCTLAAAIAAQLALGQPVEDALFRGQQFAFNALQNAFAVGRGRWIPGRAAVHQKPGLAP